MENQTAVFISDLHLGTDETSRHRAFRDFLAVLRSREPRPALFILGDLFDYWVGRHSEDAPGHRFVLNELRQATEEGLLISIIPGNRDFLLDGRVGVRCGVRILEDGLPLKLGEHRVFACHGDSLLLHDRSHLRFRWILRSGWLRTVVDCLPSTWVRCLAASLRRKTTSITERKAPAVFEIPPEAAARRFRGGYDVLICGHVHNPSCRRMVVDRRQRTFYSLGAWESTASILEFDGEKFQFSSFAIEEESDRSPP